MHGRPGVYLRVRPDLEPDADGFHRSSVHGADHRDLRGVRVRTYHGAETIQEGGAGV